MSRVTSTLCDCCHDIIEREEDWGNCTACGDNLCEACAGSWDEEGRCLACHNKARLEQDETS